ncbi:iron-containing alcohol dehydrogenase [Rhizobium rhizogenes]|uniref:iron-containing alcohol dehydrogenase n=1 Tax=Rhizobium rhizogenes TaxID=359 RepID=UPI0015734624|nr:iron-containing alcohol dehydrogenase [Rhizobium rhizogenes]NTF62970.1 iron-containing alcohol dehydrogenase [Rhizobium rhizogenes]NTG01926.1 iron-containing alcohol dehydrogenase [Rhizobium rhizogenes]NTG61889.1 iron-containing alcohol dehydrogenase [Rhizobium rhizogenes]NTG81351.1 iron-containing alcohol dehydrogenase [Rhizobium rhizogenes]NTG94303.1 iron-containing alcohol dehydrogenase [Rhizobium rhizogenes]
MSFSISAIPDIRLGDGALADLAAAVKSFEGVTATLLVIDAFLAQSGLADRIKADLAGAGISTEVFSDFSGEPKLAHLRAALVTAKGADMVIGVGGGSALDIAKIVACCAASGADPMFYALAVNPLPKTPLKKILVPTTAGTGSETSATNIFAGPEGKKLWIWGPETKADLVILDPVLTTTLPASLTAWCGLDAFIHAFEAATNRNTHPGAQFYAHQALRLITGSLETAVREPGNLEARGDVLLGSCFAGIAIDNCGTAIAHNISHALAGLAPVHHGLATALGFEATLPWLVEAGTDELNAAAKACGLESAAALPAFVSGWMDRCGIVRALPSAFKPFDEADLEQEMRAPENQPMRRSTVRDVTDAEIDRFAAAIMALPKGI